MLPGKQYSPEDIVGIAFKRKWLLLLPLSLGMMLAVLVARQLPQLYRSETLIMVMPQRVPESYAAPIVSGKIEDRLLTISDQILSRSRLERIINDFGLYKGERSGGTIMEDLVQRMRKEVDIKVEGKESFRVSYVNPDARTAQRVTERLASLSIEENLKDRRDLADSTQELLESQLEDAKTRLVEHERRLEEYRRRYSGQLPSQVPSNLQVIQNAQLQLQAAAEAANRERERRLLLERQLADLVNPDPASVLAIAATPGTPEAIAAAVSPAMQLENAKARLGVLQTQYTAEHPDVMAMKKMIRDLEAKVAADASAPATPNPAKPITAAEASRQNRIRDLRAQMEDVDRRLTEKAKEDLRLRGVIAEYQGKVDVVPTRESELVELTRDYATLQTTYTTLLTKLQDSKLAANLERRQYGEQFRVLDPASMPERPFNQLNRIAVVLGGGIGGLLIGLGIVGFLEYRDTSFSSDEDVLRVLTLPVLAVVPTLASEGDRRARHRRQLAVNIGAAALLIGSAAFAVIMWKLQS